MPIDAGKLDRQCTLSHRVLTPNNLGEKVASWKAYATVWAEKRDARGEKRFAAQQFSENLICEFTLRWRTDVVATDRITVLDSGQLFEITQIAEIDRRAGLDLLTRALIA